jgi:hypothetical protein
MTCCLALASFDEPTKSSSGAILRYVGARVEPFQLYGPLAQRPFFSLIAPQADVIIATGHGEPNAFFLQNESLVWSVGNYNLREIKDKVIKLVSCQTGKELGPDLVQNGARCFLGYDDDITWIMNSEYSFQPWLDPDAKLALMPVIDGINALLDGKTCAEAHEIEISEDLINAASTDFELVSACLQSNAAHCVIIGDVNATIKPRLNISLPPPPPLLI